jgi:hypothetical protein
VGSFNAIKGRLGLIIHKSRLSDRQPLPVALVLNLGVTYFRINTNRNGKGRMKIGVLSGSSPPLE